jgi:predicted phage terminase large subunit-like protein
MLAAYPSGWLRQQEIFGQFVDEGGVLGDRAWFNGKVVSEVPFEKFRTIRYYDLAATEKKLSGSKRNDPDETVGTRMSMSNEKPNPQFCIEHQVHGFWKWDDIKQAIADTARDDGFGVRIIVEQEPGSGGKNQIAELDSFVRREVPGHPGVEGYRPDSDRVIAANIWFADAAGGKMWMIGGEWNKEFLDQLDIFPGSTSHTHDDRITSVSGARINLAPPKKWKQVSFLHL